MGYTHYWTPAPISADDWQLVTTDFATLFRAAKSSGIKLGDGCGTGKPEISDDGIAFNGRGAESHETFSVGPYATNADFEFTKTACKPYDAVVTAALIYLAQLHGFAVQTDGEPSDWEAGLALARKAWPRGNWSIPTFAD